jgi:hypothetical protein
MTTGRAADAPPAMARSKRPRWIALAALVGLLTGAPAVFANAADAPLPTVRQQDAAKAVPCPLPALHSAQLGLDCCKGHKGVCGCRAGKIVCCDNTTSTQPGCTCHAEDGFPQ